MLISSQSRRALISLATPGPELLIQINQFWGRAEQLAKTGSVWRPVDQGQLPSGLHLYCGRARHVAPCTAEARR